MYIRQRNLMHGLVCLQVFDKKMVKDLPEWFGEDGWHGYRKVQLRSLAVPMMPDHELGGLVVPWSSPCLSTLQELSLEVMSLGALPVSWHQAVHMLTGLTSLSICARQVSPLRVP